ncbi:cell envelope integrity protein TolA [Paracoccus versutus]
MDRAERIGFWVSGVAHAGLLGAALVGGALFRPQPLEAVRMAEVATMSEAEFQSLAAAAAGRGPVSDAAATTPAQPRPPADENRLGEVEAVSPPAPDAQAAELSTPPSRPEARPDLSDFQTPNRPVAVATDAPRPAEPQNTVDLAALPQASDRPDPARNPAQPQSPAPIPQRSALAPVESSRPRGRPEGLAEAVQARRAAAEAARQREELLARQEAEAAAERTAAAKAEEAAARRAAEERAREERREAQAQADAEAARKAEEAEARARRLAAAEAADKAAAEEAAAEKRAAERKAEAERRAAAEKAAAEKAAAEKAAAEKAAAEKAEAERKAAEAKARKEAEEQAAAERAAAEKKAAEKVAAEAKAREQAEAERKAAEAAKQAALAEAMQDQGSGGSGGGGAAANGPPLSQGEKDGFRVAVEQCWNRGSLSTEASRTTVSVQFSMAPDGTVEKGSLRMIGHDGGSDAAAKQAYEAARRAILMCEKGGYKLPPEKYNRWKDVIIDFNASGGARVK